MYATVFDLGGSFTSSTLETSATILGDLQAVLALVVGVFVAVVVISLLIKALLK